VSEKAYKTTVIVIVLAIIGAGAWWKLSRRGLRESLSRQSSRSSSAEAPSAAPASGEAQLPAVEERAGDTKQPSSDEPAKALPAVIDLGMGRCIPCKAMKPILEELANEYRGRARIEIIDIGERPEAAEQYKVMLIPTQVFVDATGTELYRHEGFMSKEDIVAKLAEMGVE